MYVTFYAHSDDSTFSSPGEIKPPAYGIVVGCTTPRRLNLQALVAGWCRSVGRWMTHRRLNVQAQKARWCRCLYLATPARNVRFGGDVVARRGVGTRLDAGQGVRGRAVAMLLEVARLLHRVDAWRAVKNGRECTQIAGLECPLFTDKKVQWLKKDSILWNRHLQRNGLLIEGFVGGFGTSE